MEAESGMRVRIAYFSGTGSTRHVAYVLRDEVEARGHAVELVRIGRSEMPESRPCDLLVLCHVVHAANAPRPVIDWVRAQPDALDTPAVIISVSGGGEVTPNLACRVRLKRELARKGFSVFYEKMIVMPSNWIVATEPTLVNRLLTVLPHKVAHAADEFLDHTPRLYSPPPGNRLLSLLGRLEQLGAPQFGEKIRVETSCNGCGVCVRGCPVSNIELREGRPVFADRCTLCLQCIYACPTEALVPGTMTFIVIKDGFDFQRMLAECSEPVDLDVEQETRGYLWLGVRRYLLSTQDMRESTVRSSVSEG